MIKIREYDEVTQINMGREISGNVLYWVSAYLVDGMLIDTGCSHTSAQLTDGQFSSLNLVKSLLEADLDNA